ncbi:MAG: 2-dehydropantoate 2-reductase N-terminal domain-containing protein [Porticoccaceae bacterium]
MNMADHAVLIVGAGAVGMACGYQLSHGGVAVTYLVRPESLGKVQPPVLLYSYDDHETKVFHSYRLTSCAEELGDRIFDFVIFTLDGAACRSREGSDLIRRVARATRDGQAPWIIAGVGSGLREHFLALTGFPETRFLEGSLGMLCHQVEGWHFPPHPDTDQQQLADCRFAYRHFPNRAGFMLAASPKKVAREFASLYNGGAASRCQMMSLTSYRVLSNMLYPLFATCEIRGWPRTDELARDRKIWRECCRAMNQIAGLHLSFAGRLLFPMLFRPWLYLMLLRRLERDCAPLDFHGFNRFHHGAKVLAQGIQIMENAIREGEAQGRDMSAVRHILGRLKSHFEQTGNAGAGLIGAWL